MTAAMKRPRLFISTTLFLLLLLLLVAQCSATRDAEQPGKWKWWMDRARAARKEAGTESHLNCWRRGTTATVKGTIKKVHSCPPGYHLKFGFLCTANCPLDMPVKCGAMCLPFGHGCGHDVAKKVTVSVLLVSKILGFGFGLDQICALGVAATDGQITDDSRRLVEDTPRICRSEVEKLSTLSADDFADLVMTLFPDAVKVKSGHNALRRLPKSTTAAPAKEVSAVTCGQTFVAAVGAIWNAYKTATAKPVDKKKVVATSTEAAKAVKNVVDSCGGKTGLGNGMVTLIEVIAHYVTEHYVDHKDWDKIVAEMGLRLLYKLDPIGIVAFAHEFVHGFCELDTVAVKDIVFDKDVAKMDEQTRNLALEKKGASLVSVTGSWHPNDAKHALELKLTNGLDVNVKVKVYTGGRSFRRNGEKVVAHIKAGVKDAVVVATALDQVRAATLMIVVVVDESVFQRLGAKVKQFVNKITMKLGKKTPVFDNVPEHRLATMKFWVPGVEKKGLLQVKGELRGKPATTTPSNP